MNYYLKLLAKKEKMISFEKNNGEITAATILSLYPHYFFDLLKENIKDNFNLILCSKSLLLNKLKLTKAVYCSFEKRHLLPMQRIIQSKVTRKILSQLIEKNIINEKYNLLRFLRLDKLQFNSIDIISKSKGLGFTGTIKRFNFKQGPKSHGSKSHRRPGSIGAGTSPGRVLKNKKMAGHFGNRMNTIKNIEVLFKNNYQIIVKGPIPGKNKSDIFVIVKF